MLEEDLVVLLVEGDREVPQDAPPERGELVRHLGDRVRYVERAQAHDLGQAADARRPVPGEGADGRALDGPNEEPGREAGRVDAIAAPLPESMSAANCRSPSRIGISGVLSALLKRIASPGSPSSGMSRAEHDPLVRVVEREDRVRGTAGSRGCRQSGRRTGRTGPSSRRRAPARTRSAPPELDPGEGHRVEEHRAALRRAHAHLRHAHRGRLARRRSASRAPARRASPTSRCRSRSGRARTCPTCLDHEDVAEEAGGKRHGLGAPHGSGRAGAPPGGS
jgi:hypothetical protein